MLDFVSATWSWSTSFSRRNLESIVRYRGTLPYTRSIFEKLTLVGKDGFEAPPDAGEEIQDQGDVGYDLSCARWI